MTTKLTAKQTEDFKIVVANIDSLLLFPEGRIAGQIDAVAERAGSGRFWELNKTTAKKLFALGLIERGARRGNDYRIKLTGVVCADIARDAKKAPAKRARKPKIETTLKVLDGVKTYEKGSYAAVAAGRGKYRLLVGWQPVGSIVFAGGFWTAQFDDAGEGSPVKARTVKEAFERIIPTNGKG